MRLTQRIQDEPPLRILVYGAGGHGIEVAAAVRALGHEVTVRGGLQSDGPLHYVADLNALKLLQPDGYIVAVGDNQTRRVLANRLLDVFADTVPWVVIVHPSAWVDPTAVFGPGVYVAAGAVVQGQAMIGSGSIVNTGAVVSHGCNVGAFCHIAPNATLCGDVTVDSLAFVGAGSVVKEGVLLGGLTVVGCGAAVVNDWRGATVIGVPARRMVSNGAQEQTKG